MNTLTSNQIFKHSYIYKDYNIEFKMTTLTVEQIFEKSKQEQLSSYELLILSKDGSYSYLYADTVLNLDNTGQGIRFQLGEEAISKDAYNSLYYTINVINRNNSGNKIRFELGEKTISKNPHYSKKYINFINENNNKIDDDFFETFKEYLIP